MSSNEMIFVFFPSFFPSSSRFDLVFTFKYLSFIMNSIGQRFQTYDIVLKTSLLLVLLYC